MVLGSATLEILSGGRSVHVGPVHEHSFGLIALQLVLQAFGLFCKLPKKFIL